MCNVNTVYLQVVVVVVIIVIIVVVVRRQNNTAMGKVGGRTLEPYRTDFNSSPSNADGNWSMQSFRNSGVRACLCCVILPLSFGIQMRTLDTAISMRSI